MNPCASYKHEHKGPFRPGLDGTMVCIACDEAVLNHVAASKPDDIPVFEYIVRDNPDDEGPVGGYGPLSHFTKPEPSLQLLVIDLGESCCVVKVEKAPSTGLRSDSFRGDGWIYEGDTQVAVGTFAEVKAAIDAMDEKPVPRIEWGNSDNCYLHFENGREIALSNEQYHELSKLAGVPIQVYEGGKWEELSRCERDALPLSVWRYTR
jgi:hypothetical protein